MMVVEICTGVALCKWVIWRVVLSEGSRHGQTSGRGAAKKLGMSRGQENTVLAGSSWGIGWHAKARAKKGAREGPETAAFFVLT